MDKQILLCVDAHFSPATQAMLRAVGELVQQTGSAFSFILIHSIPMMQVIAGQPGYYIEQPVALTPSLEQRKQGQLALYKARLVLQQYDIPSERIEEVVRVGAVADEIVQVARERHVHFIAIGSRGSALRHELRRFLLGSISRRVLQLAPCPVMIATAPQDQPGARKQQPQRARATLPPGKDLVAWYEEELRSYLKGQQHILTILTAREVAQLFLPAHKKRAGRQEIEASSKALDRLANMGLLCRHDVEGEIRYIND